MREIVLNQHEAMLTAIPEYCPGPQLDNAVLWVYIYNYDQETLREEAIQPKDRTARLDVLFSAVAGLYGQLIDEVMKHYVTGGKQ